MGGRGDTPGKLRVAIAGCGGMGTRHATLLRAHPDAEVTLLVDPHPAAIERLRERAALPDAPAVGSLEDPALGDLADAVVIATHHDLHPAQAVIAAGRGKHVFIEKPLALTQEGCHEVERAVARAGVQLMVGFQARHSPYVQLARQAIPHPRILVGEMIDPRWGDGSWAQSPDTGGGNVLSQGVHTFDLLCYLAGSEPLAVHAEGGTLTHDPSVTRVIDSVVATIRFAGGTVATAVVGDFGPDAYTGKSFYQLFDGAGRSATVYGYHSGVRVFDGQRYTDYGPSRVTRGRLAGGGHLAQAEEEEPSTAHLPPPEGAGPLGPDGYAGEMAEFVRCAREGRPPRIGAGVRDGTRATRLALACFESIRSGATVSLPPAAP